MKKCDCGGAIGFLSLYPICDACLRDYLAQLPERPGFTVEQFRAKQAQARQQRAAYISVLQPPQRIRLLETSIDPVTRDEVLATIERFVEEGTPRQIVTVNVDFVRIAQDNDRFRAVVNGSDLSVADGKPLLWAARWTGQELPARITGMDLVLGSAELAVRRNEGIFLLGAAEGIAAEAAAMLCGMCPGLKVDFYSPPFGPFTNEENARMIERIRAFAPKYLFVAFGAPRQDLWINEHMNELGVPVCAGIGGVFNFLAGVTKRAPAWVQNIGMEWAYRIMQEPARLWRRYFMEDLPIFVRMLAEPVVPTTAAARTIGRSVAAATHTMSYDRNIPTRAGLEATGGSR